MWEGRPLSGQLPCAMAGLCTVSPGPGKAEKTTRKAEREDMGSSTRRGGLSPIQQREGTLTHDKPSLVFYNSESKREDDPMGSGTIIPLMTWVEILVPSSGVREGPNGLAGLGEHSVPN